MEFPNGWIISVQWGPGNYCETRRKNEDGWISPFDGRYHEFVSTTAEIAVMHKDHSRMYPISEHDDVKGWVSATDVAGYIQWVSQLDSDYDKVMAEAPNKGLGEVYQRDYHDDVLSTFRML
tara:strand:+ start:326 stop:688 length:363 start_codon:yes stop_codon:yes gene_type:complete